MKERLNNYDPELNITVRTKNNSNDIVEQIKNMTKEKVFNFIRSALIISGERLRFDMSGYDTHFVGECTVHNTFVLNRFAHLGIYDYTKYLTVDCYKGTPTIHFLYWDWKPEDDDLYDDFHDSNSKLSGYTTTEIIYEIFKLTILSGREKRRR